MSAHLTWGSQGQASCCHSSSPWRRRVIRRPDRSWTLPIASQMSPSAADGAGKVPAHRMPGSVPRCRSVRFPTASTERALGARCGGHREPSVAPGEVLGVAESRSVCTSRSLRDLADLVGPQVVDLALCGAVSTFAGVFVSPICRIPQLVVQPRPPDVHRRGGASRSSSTA